MRARNVVPAPSSPTLGRWRSVCGTTLARSTRRLLLASTLVALLSLVQGVAGRGEVRAQVARRPNILIILADDQRGGMAAAMDQTARLFKAGGREYPNGYVTTTLCCPSRASFLTGEYVHNHNVRGNLDGENLDHSKTIARYLHDAGYRTAMFGKYMNAFTADPPHFDRWATFGNAKEGYVGGTWNVDGVSKVIEEYGSDYIGRRAQNFISNTTRPWFALLAPSNPHRPYTPEPVYAQQHYNSPCGPSVPEADRSDKPLYVWNSTPLSCAQSVALRDKQFRTLESLDDMVQQVMATVASTGEDTLTFYVSDNGYLWGEHGLDRKSHAYRETLDIPYFIRWPGHVAPGSVDNRWAANIDVAPTIFHVTGVTPLHKMDGTSLLKPSDRDHLFAEYFKRRQASGYPTPTYSTYVTHTLQYTEYYNSDGTLHFREYYNLSSDPFELLNLFGDGKSGNNPDVTALHAQLARDMKCEGDTCP
jgi:arylsulfatase A-like enzyme